MCDRVGCDKPGEWRPKIVFVLQDKSKKQQWVIPAFIGLLICYDCRKGLTKVEEFLTDNKVELSIKRLRPNTKILRKSVSWCHKDSDEAKQFDKIRPN